MFFEDATLKGLHHRPPNRKPVATPSELRRNDCAPFFTQRFKANAPTPRGLPARGPRPGLKLANEFGVNPNSDRLVDRKTS